MKNFEKADIITNVAFNKNKKQFLPRNEQLIINNVLKDKLLRFLTEIQSDPNRPSLMKVFDEMMNQMHGQRVKDLYAYRRSGNHVVALLDSNIPPELVYGLDQFVPVGVCMGAGEVEQYADEFTRGMSSPVRSMIGFLKTGMCVFFNLSDFVIGTDLCPEIKNITGIIKNLSNDFNVHCITYNENEKKIELNYDRLLDWINQSTNQKGINKERFLKFCKIYSELRETYQRIANLRALPNPPIDGRNSLWLQQLYPVQEPEVLLNALKQLEIELRVNVSKGIGYNEHGNKRRVMLITPRIMPPFTEIYRLIELNGGLIVYEQTDMGITNINYQYENMYSIAKSHEWNQGKAIKYLMESIEKNDASCFSVFNQDKIRQAINDYHVEAVVCFNFNDSEAMELKLTGIANLLKRRKIPVLQIQSDYLQLYQQEPVFARLMNEFLNVVN